MSISPGKSIGDDVLKFPRPQVSKNINNIDPPGASAPLSLAHSPSGKAGAFKGARTDGEGVPGSLESVVTFTVAGIFGAGRLASRLKELESVDLIGPWHVGHWIDYTHTAIRIRFSSPADARAALIKIGFSAVPPDAPKLAAV